MPRNATGTYSLPAGNPVVPGTLIESTWANPTMADLGNEITKSLPRDGTAPMTGPLILSRDGVLAREAVTVQQMTNSISGTNSFMPAGTVQLFAMNAVPTGWLECNGAAVSRTTYANLFASIGTTYGAGNGVTTFNLPDLRGQFVRGFDNGKGVDPGRAFGSNQDDTNKSHNHVLTDPTHIHGQAAHTHGVTDPGHTHVYRWGLAVGPTGYPGVDSQGNNSSSSTDPANTGITINSSQPSINPSSTGITIAAEGGEGRPKNVAMIYCIKAYGALQVDGLGSMAFQSKETVYITGGAGTFTTLKSNTAPVDPTDVVRLGDLGVQLADIFSDDPAMLTVDKSNPANPILRPQSNLPGGMVKLNASGKIPASVLDVTDASYQGPWSAVAGVLPTGVFNTGDYYTISAAGTLTLHEAPSGGTVAQPVNVGDTIIFLNVTPTYPTAGWYYQPVPVASSLAASAITFAPTGSIAATNVQAAIAELDTEKAVAATTVSKDATTGAALLPVGTTAQRPASPVDGMMRYNTDLDQFEGYDTVSGWAPTGGFQSASQTPFTPAGNISATDTQAAIQELDSEKAPISSGVPAGAVMNFAQVAAPSGWLECNGQAVSRTGVGAALFAAIGTFYGVGDGVATFNVPDYRGYFLRSLGTNADGAASGARGAKVADDNKAHTHTGTTGGQSNDHVHYYNRQDWGAGVQGGSSYTVGGPQVNYGSSGSSQDHNHSFTSNSTGGTEARPKNIAVLTCIKL